MKLIINKKFVLKKFKKFTFLKLNKIITAIKYSNKINIPVILMLKRNAVKNENNIVFLMVIFSLS